MPSSRLELLMPAGSVTKMNLALDYGADAVYLGPPLYSLRARENDFQKEQLNDSIRQVHQRGKKAYVTLNIFARNRKIKPFTEDIHDYAAMKPDAFIMSDPGLISIVRDSHPEIPVHLSVQANCMNWQSVRFWQKSLGVERIILSRELSITEIKEIKQRVPDIELEAFVHGSICIAYSGRCLLSSYMDKRDANQGVCDNSCREKYKVYEKEFYIEDEQNDAGKLYEIDEDEHGTYILNAKDLCMIQHLDKLAEAGVISFKVEGRTKSEFYAAMVARSYRGAIDDVEAGRAIDPYWLNELQKLSNRGYHTAFMLENPRAEGQNYVSSTVYNPDFKCVGVIKNALAPNKIEVEIKNKLKAGEQFQLIQPYNKSFETRVLSITDAEGNPRSEVHSGAGKFIIELDRPLAHPQSALLISGSTIGTKI